MPLAVLHYCCTQVCGCSTCAVPQCSSTFRDCETDWDLKPALDELQQRGNRLLTETCLKYQPRPRPAATKIDLCSKARRCDDPGPEASQGAFFYKPFTEGWQVGNILSGKILAR